jgi:hypothetical protein|tara:strand:+ start:114 stop:263 length:150 start_codon:yes stop_codon:yes gene_type:complete
LVLEKGLVPKKPLLAENGDGCADLIIKLLSLLIILSLACAFAPHNIKTI